MKQGDRVTRIAGRSVASFADASFAADCSQVMALACTGGPGIPRVIGH